MTRYIIMSDLHGNKKNYINALNHANFDRGRDHLVINGDWVDIGKDSIELWEMIKKDAKTILIGNHELAHIIQQDIFPYDRSLDFTPMFKEIGEMVINGEIRLVRKIGDTLVSHAGITNALHNSTQYPYIYGTKDLDVIELALNNNLRTGLKNNGRFELKSEGKWLAQSPISPLWVRLEGRGTNLSYTPLDIKQIIGHTPDDYYYEETIEEFRDKGIILCDPFIEGIFHNENYYRYVEATVEDGITTIKLITYQEYGGPEVVVVK